MAVVTTLPAETAEHRRRAARSRTSPIVGTPETTVDAERTRHLRRAGRQAGDRADAGSPDQGPRPRGCCRSGTTAPRRTASASTSTCTRTSCSTSTSTCSPRRRSRSGRSRPAPGSGSRHRTSSCPRRSCASCIPSTSTRLWFADFASDFPVVDGTSRLRVVDVGHATPADLAGRQAARRAGPGDPLRRRSRSPSSPTGRPRTAPRSSSSATTAPATSPTRAAPA